MAREDLRSESFMDDFRSDAQSASSPYPTQCPRPAKEKLKRPPQPRVSDRPTAVQPPPSLHDRTDTSTTTSGIDSSSYGGYSSSDNTSSYPSRPSDEANSQPMSTLLNHQYFQPSDAICSFEDEEKYEPLKLLSSGDTTIRNSSGDLSYSSEDDDDDSFIAHSTFQQDDPFSATDPFSAGNKSKAEFRGKNADSKNPMIDSAGFLVAPGDDNIDATSNSRPESPASKTFASRSSTFNFMYESESSADEWVDVTRLTDEELGQIYDSCRDGDGVSPLSFSKLMRYVGGGSNSKGNPYAEMTLFAQFSADGHGGRGVLSKKEFVRGVRRVEEEDGIESSLYQRLIQHVRD